MTAFVGLLSQLLRDALSLARHPPSRQVTVGSFVRTLSYDGFAVLGMTRLREAARRWHVPGVNRALRIAQMAIYNIEISKDAQLGEGVNFMHTIGMVIGGDARIGARTMFMGSVTVGNLDNRGYPVIGEDVIVGAGARILGPVRIGNGALIGANAVVVTDVPDGCTAVGVPAVVKPRKGNGKDRSRAS